MNRNDALALAKTTMVDTGSYNTTGPSGAVNQVRIGPPRIIRDVEQFVFIYGSGFVFDLDARELYSTDGQIAVEIFKRMAPEQEEVAETALGTLVYDALIALHQAGFEVI